MDRIQVFSLTNKKLFEFSASVHRTWETNRVGQAQLSIPFRSVGNDAILTIGTRWLISNPDLPDWTGILTTPVVAGDGRYNLTLASAETLLDWRFTDWNETLSGTGGAIVLALIALANAIAPTGITGGQIDTTGTTIERNYRNSNIGQAIREITSDLDTIFWVTGAVSSGVLALAFNYGATRGGEFATEFIERHNLYVSSAGYDGSIANDITAIGFADSDAETPPSYRAQDTTSQGLYGVMQDVILAPDMENSSSLQGIANSHLSKRAYPKLKVVGVITQPPFPSVGDKITMRLNSKGVFDGKYTMRVEQTAYDSLENLLAVSVKELSA